LVGESCPEDSKAAKRFFEQGWDFPSTKSQLHQFLTLPVAWPLARLTFPLVNLLKQLELMLQAYCFETIACSLTPAAHHEQVVAFAQDLVQCMALYLAEMVVSLFQGVLVDVVLVDVNVVVLVDVDVDVVVDSRTASPNRLPRKLQEQNHCCICYENCKG